MIKYVIMVVVLVC